LRATDTEAVLAALDQLPVTRSISLPETVATVHYDGALVVRLLRYMLAAGASSGPELSSAGVPALLHAVDQGQLDRLDRRVTAQIAGDQPYCLGYLPKCERNHRISLGAYLSHLCSDLGPLPAANAADTPTSDPWSTAFVQGPYVDVCDQWPISRATKTAATAFNSDVPVLVTVGAFDPFVNVQGLRKGLAGIRRLQIVTAAQGAHNVIGAVPCVTDLRNRWIDDPTVTSDCPATDGPSFVPTLQ